MDYFFPEIQMTTVKIAGSLILLGLFSVIQVRSQGICTTIGQLYISGIKLVIILGHCDE